MDKARRLRAALVAGALAATVGLPAPAGAASETAWNLGSALSTLVYAPAKAAYAATGLVVGGIGWGLSGGNREVMDAIVTPAVRGDYLVTPAHLRGERRLVFVGSQPGYEAEPAREVAGPPEPEPPPRDPYWGY